MAAALLGHGSTQLAAQAEEAVRGFSNPDAPNWAFGDLAGARCDLALVRLHGGNLDGAADALRPDHRRGTGTGPERRDRDLLGQPARAAPPVKSGSMYPVARSSARLALRELHADDVELALAVYDSPEATEHLSFDPRTHDQVEQIVTRSITSATETPRTEYALAVVERATAELIGFGRLALDPHQQRAATMGFALRPDKWGVGYGVETVRLLLGVGFEDLGLHRVWGARSPLNEASAKTMSAAGMVEEGTIREHVLKAGKWRDSVVHAILDREWHAV